MKTTDKQLLAVDLGASSGRVMLGRFDGEKISVEELHRFSNDPVTLGGTMYWDFLRLFHEIRQGLLKSKKYGKVDSISVDTWGVDFGLLDEGGYLLENPVHYRDSRVNGMLEKSFALLDADRFYQITGTQFMEINTVFQLLYLAQNRRELLDRADCMLLMPDLFHYFLCGEKSCEYSIASTTQLLDARRKTWSKEVLKALGLPEKILQPVIPSGTPLSPLRPDIAGELGVDPMLVVAGAGHGSHAGKGFYFHQLRNLEPVRNGAAGTRHHAGQQETEYRKRRRSGRTHFLPEKYHRPVAGAGKPPPVDAGREGIQLRRAGKAGRRGSAVSQPD